MTRDIRVLAGATLTAALLVLPAAASAQAPPKAQEPVAPKAQQLDPNACAQPDTRSTVGKGGDAEMEKQGNSNLSDKLARSGGVICPPQQVDPDIKAPTPRSGGTMPVIPPPGSPGGDPNIQPK
ncbi:MAG TPA: hypothetical protein VHT93_01175 [Pseudolabrys sp.]|jgi:hypothetical protein|nr:hypothetical protein [Pseudolabrys sp.]